MVFRKLLKRFRDKRKWAKREKMSRIEYLLDLGHDMLEGRRYADSDLNFLELVEQQLQDGKIELAIFNIGRQSGDCFRLANLYWGQGDLANAEKYLRMTLERYYRLLAAVKAHDWPHLSGDNAGQSVIKCAAVLLGVEPGGPLRDFESKIGYLPWFENFLLDACIGTQDFDLDAWQAGEDAWLKHRFPRYKLKEYEVYVKALTGGFASDAEMLAAHETMFTGRASRPNADAGIMDGYQDNELVIDHIFAAILKRIGWEGTYRHSWPGTCPVGAPAGTTQGAHRHLRVIAPPPPAPDAETGIITDLQAARRFIDTHLKDQRDHWDNTFHDPVRPAKEVSKVSGALKELGWKADAATLDLMRAYRMDAILNNSTHIMLSDPIGDRYTGLKKWNQLLNEEFGLHPDFIAVAESEEKTDYRDPQGGWYVYWTKDKRIYAVQREDWDRPEVATANARIGKELWPSYISFVAWWVAQHLAFER